MKNNKVMEITKIAIVISLILVLGLTPVGYIMVGMLQITTVHAVVILIAIIFGLKYGIIAGTTFGVTSLITAIMTPVPFSPIFFNPLVSIVPRIVLGVVAYFIFKSMMFFMRNIENKRTSISISAAVTAAAATLIHSLLVLAMTWVFRWMSAELTPEMLNVSMITIATVNMPSEIILATVVSAIAAPILYPVFNKHHTDVIDESIDVV